MAIAHGRVRPTYQSHLHSSLGMWVPFTCQCHVIVQSTCHAGGLLTQMMVTWTSRDRITKFKNLVKVWGSRWHSKPNTDWQCTFLFAPRYESNEEEMQYKHLFWLGDGRWVLWTSNICLVLLPIFRPYIPLVTLCRKQI